MEIRTADYAVWKDEETSTIYLEGVMRLNAPTYQEIGQVLKEQLEEAGESLTLDVGRLELLNSSGINFLAKFTISVRSSQLARFVVKGSRRYPWQSKSLKNLQRLYPAMTLEME